MKKIKKVKAIFKGENGSCGYTHNMEYSLFIEHISNSAIKIEKIEGGGHCEYASMVSFLENWDNVRVL